MQNSIKFFVNALASGLLALTIGCAFGKSKDDSKEQENRDELLNVYSAVQGTYEGYLYKSRAGSAPVKAQFILYTMNEPSGTRNDKGQERMIPVLKGFLKLNDLSTYSQGMSIRYLEQGGSFVANGKNSVNGSENLAIEIDGSLIGNSLIADYKKENGKIGRIELYRTTNTTTTFSETADADFFADLRKAYCRIQGSYETSFLARDGVEIPLRFELNVANTLMDGKTIPKMEATVSTPNFEYIQPRLISVQVEVDTDPVEVYMNSAGSSSANGSANLSFSFFGTWTGSNMDGNLVTFGQNQGRKVLKLNKKLRHECQ